MTKEPAFQSFLEKLRAKVNPIYQMDVTISDGAKYARIVQTREGTNPPQRSAYGFLVLQDTATVLLGKVKRGDLLKAAGWSAPAKNVRGSIFDSSNGMDCCNEYSVR